MYMYVYYPLHICIWICADIHVYLDKDICRYRQTDRWIEANNMHDSRVWVDVEGLWHLDSSQALGFDESG